MLIGKDFCIKTIYCTLLLSGLLFLFEWFFPLHSPLTNQPFMELMVAMLLSATGAGLLFNVGASSGGTDIVAMVLKKHFRLYNISTALMITDFLAALATFFIFDITTGIFSLFGLVTRGAVLQWVLGALRQRKYFHIITADEDKIKQFIIGNLARSATVFEGQGAYSGQRRTLIVTAVSTREAVALKRFVKSHSPQSFVLITNTDDIIGNGFRNNL
ncbi:MAG: YitT family protein [Christensenellales bacterium]